jgi:hypothetical protein
MAWLKLDDQIFYNRKVAQCDAETKLLYIVGLTYCANQLTDGFIPEATLPLLAGMAGIEWQIAKQSASKLLDICLWFATENGWQIPDYLDYNPSKEQVLHNRDVRSEAGKRGGRVKAGKMLANSQQNAKQNPSKILHPSPSPSEEEERAPSMADQRKMAIDAIRQAGILNADVLSRFEDMWPELVQSQRVDWIYKALDFAKAKGAAVPSAYAMSVLANSLMTDREPGYVNGQNQDADTRPRVPAPSKEAQAAADARQAAYEQQVAEELARAGRI